MNEGTMEEVGIKETSEVLTFIGSAAAAIAKAKVDGVIDWKDLLNAETRAMIPAMLAAANDGNLISAEMKNLSPEEINVLLDKLTVVVSALVIAVMS